MTTKWLTSNYGITQKKCFAFIVQGPGGFSFNYIYNGLFWSYFDSCHVSMHLKNILWKLMHFCLLILAVKMKENKQHFGITFYFKEGKNESQNKNICIVYE